MIIFKNVAIYFNKEKPRNLALSKEISKFLKEQGVKMKIYDNCEEQNIAPGTDLLICLGGDGTLLHAARGVVAQKIKLFGINAGTLGFLTSANLDNYKEILSQVLRGRYKGLDLDLLSVSIYKNGKYITKEQPAFNDCVIKTSGARAFTLELTSDGKNVEKFFGDGMIIATPTGSTAYSLAAGGPIVAPEVDVMLLTPICPHTLTQRPIVMPGSSQFIFTPRFNREDDYATVSLDGQITYKIHSGDNVLIYSGKHRIKLLQEENYNFFQTLNTKFKWSLR